jgi:hypothetical protein
MMVDQPPQSTMMLNGWWIIDVDWYDWLWYMIKNGDMVMNHGHESMMSIGIALR